MSSAFMIGAWSLICWSLTLVNLLVTGESASHTLVIPDHVNTEKIKLLSGKFSQFLKQTSYLSLISLISFVEIREECR